MQNPEQRSKRHNYLIQHPFFDNLDAEPATARRRYDAIGGSARKWPHSMPEFRRFGRWPFPGEFAGASLKRIYRGTSVNADLDHSPVNSPGPH